MPTILLYGDNSVEIDDAARAVRRPFDTADTVILNGPDMQLSALSEACLTAGLFAPERLVIVHALHERLKGTRKESSAVEEIRSIIGSVAPTTTLLLVDRGMPADHVLVTEVRKAGGELRQFSTPRRNDLPRWIASRGKLHGTRIEPQAAEMLADLVGGNAVMLDSELEKLATYAADEGTITSSMVATLVGAVPQDTIFALVDAVAAGDQAKALQLLHAQLESASSGPVDFALYLIRMLARQMRILLRLKLGQEAGRPLGQITADLKIPRYYTDRYVKQARRLSRERLRGSFEQLAALEHGLKSGRAEPNAGLDLLIADLCA